MDSTVNIHFSLHELSERGGKLAVRKKQRVMTGWVGELGKKHRNYTWGNLYLIFMNLEGKSFYTRENVHISFLLGWNVNKNSTFTAAKMRKCENVFLAKFNFHFSIISFLPFVSFSAKEWNKVKKQSTLRRKKLKNSPSSQTQADTFLPEPSWAIKSSSRCSTKEELAADWVSRWERELTANERQSITLKRKKTSSNTSRFSHERATMRVDGWEGVQARVDV